MMKPIHGSKRQSGIALLSAMILLVAITLIAFFANRSLLFEQKTSASHYRSTIAMETAEAGLEWVLANLNSPRKIDTTNTAGASTSCRAKTAPASGDKIFRDLYLDPDGNGSYAEAFSPVRPACINNGNGWSCRCPASDAPVLPVCTASTGCPVFSVQLLHVPDQPAMVEVISTGCNTHPCSSADATAKVRQIFKLQSALGTPPAAPLTTKGNVNFGSNAITVTNTELATNGITINAGGNIGDVSKINNDTVKSIPGTPAAASLVGNDASLSTLSNDQLFQTFFGQSKDALKNAPSTVRIAGSGGATALQGAINGGARVIWADGDMSLHSNATYGSAIAPIILIVNGNLHINGGLTIYGLVYSGATNWDNTGGGNARIIGAAVAEGNFTTTGTPNPTYDMRILNNLKFSTGQFGKVPGSWRDF